MNITIINGTSRTGNQTQKVTDVVIAMARSLGRSVSLIDLTNFIAGSDHNQNLGARH